jgi:DNA-binding MarR family transcriptional regulator
LTRGSRGYIARERDLGDGRCSNLILTPEARKLKPAMLVISKRMNRRLFPGLNDRNREDLFRLIERIYKIYEGDIECWKQRISKR